LTYKYAVIGVTVKVAHAFDRTIVLPFWFIKSNADPDALLELGFSNKLYLSFLRKSLSSHNTASNSDIR
jgi:hypothetical protein